MTKAHAKRLATIAKRRGIKKMGKNELISDLTRLEWFAGMALNAWIDTDHWTNATDLAKRCFDVAEAMLAESERREK